jgi:hypothetical protein
MIRVAGPTFTTAGRPYSRATTLAAQLPAMSHQTRGREKIRRQPGRCTATRISGRTRSSVSACRIGRPSRRQFGTYRKPVKQTGGRHRGRCGSIGS